MSFVVNCICCWKSCGNHKILQTQQRSNAMTLNNLKKTWVFEIYQKLAKFDCVLGYYAKIKLVENRLKIMNNLRKTLMVILGNYFRHVVIEVGLTSSTDIF